MRLTLPQRILFFIPTLWCIISIQHLLIQYIPGDYNSVLAAEQWTSIAEETQNHEINQSHTTSHINTSSYLLPSKQHLSALLQFKFGNSFEYQQPVWNIISSKIGLSLTLSMLSTILAYSLAIPLGIWQAQHQQRRKTKLCTQILILFKSTPHVLMVTLTLTWLCDHYGLFPSSGLISPDYHHYSLIGKITDIIWHLILPILLLSINHIGKISALTRDRCLQEHRQNYVLTARSKGCSTPQIFYHHIFPNIRATLLATMPKHFMNILLKRSLLIEILFNLDGIGLLIYEAFANRDYPILLACLYLGSILNFAVHNLSDYYLFQNPASTRKSSTKKKHKLTHLMQANLLYV